MPWEDAGQFLLTMSEALDSFDWTGAAALSNEISDKIKKTADPFPPKIAKQLLAKLRRKQRFGAMAAISESLVQSGVSTPTVQRQYAQALIDQGLLTPAESMLRSIVQDPNASAEEFEARGLIGRIYKQLYVNRNDPKSPANQQSLERALNEYLYVYRIDPKEHLWHGINVVALAARAQRDGISITGLPDPKALAQEIRKTLDEKEAKSESLPCWDLATRLEACVAMGETVECQEAAATYVTSDDADAFEINSTLRQLTEVWQINNDEAPGKQILPILKSFLLKKTGGVLEQDLQKVKDERKAVDAAIADPALQAIFGDDRMVTLKWYRKGLDQCNSIARIEKLDGKGHGTGWLVNAADFFSNRTGMLLLTNGHVITDSYDPFSNPLAITPDEANANFQALGNDKIYPLGEVVWTSGPDAFDATFVEIKGVPPATPLVIHKKAVQLAKPTPRLYVIGHPGGGDLQLSLQDNYLLGCSERLLHYRTPTEHGSSGSPVFEPDDWRVVALHHKGSAEMNRLDGQPGTYAANEGISLLAIQKEPK
jgi:hypothetical protein